MGCRISSLPPVLQRPVNAGKCKSEAEQEEQQQDGGGGGAEGRKRKKAMYYAFVLIIPRRPGDIQAASVPQLGFGRRVIRGSAGERLQRSSISRALRRWVQRDGDGGGCSEAPVCGRFGQLPSQSVSGNEKTMSPDMN